MITDILTVMWKESKELVFLRGNARGGLIGLLVFVGVFGILMPLQTGPLWVEEPAVLLPWAWLPFLLVSSVVADSFAGERERHTLETLLASRLSDRAILFGKLGAAVAYGWGMTVISLTLGLITVNIAFGQGELLIYPAEVLVGILVLTLLVAGLAAGLGVLISLRAATVRQAQQTFSLAFLLIFLPAFALQFLPREWMLRLTQAAATTDWRMVAVVVMAVLFVLDAVLIAAAMARFRRSQLILD